MASYNLQAEKEIEKLVDSFPFLAIAIIYFFQNKQAHSGLALI